MTKIWVLQRKVGPKMVWFVSLIYLFWFVSFYNNSRCVQGVCKRVFGPAFKARTRINFFTFKVRTFWQSEVKSSVLALWLCALSSLLHNMGVGGYGCNPLFVRARHVQRCVKKCPHFECVIHRFVLALNAWTNTLYTRVYIVSSLWMPGQVGVCGVCVARERQRKFHMSTVDQLTKIWPTDIMCYLQVFNAHRLDHL